MPKQELNANGADWFKDSKDACWELVDVDPIDGVGSSTRPIIQTLRQFSDPLPVPAPRPNINKDIQWSYPGDNTSTSRVYQLKKPMTKPRASKLLHVPFEPRCEKTGLRNFRPGPTQTGLQNHRRWLDA